MKLLKLSFFLFLLFFASGIQELSAQISGENKLTILTTRPDALNVCGGSEGFSVLLKNTRDVPATGLQIKIVMPEGVVLDESVPVTGALFQHFDNGNKSRPVLSIVQLNAGQSVTITYSAKANCDVISVIRLTNPGANLGSVKNFTQVTYTASTINYVDNESGGSSSYNILITDIDVFIDQQYASIETNVGDDQLRKIRIRNSGLGSLSTLKLIVVYPGAPLQEQISFKLGTLTLTPTSTIAPSTYIYQISNFTTAVNGSNSNGNPSVFEPDEEFVINEVVRAKQCDPSIRTDFTVEWGCDSKVCNQGSNNAAFVAYLSTPTGNPYIAGSIQVLTPTDLCGSTTGEVEFVYTNTATGNNYINRATNIQLTFRRRYYPIIDPSGDIRLYVKNVSNPSTGTFVSLTTLGLSLTQVSEEYWQVSLNNHPATHNIDFDGPGGLEDLDQDGYFDDLKAGEVIKARFRTTPSCQQEEAFNNCNGINYHLYNGMRVDYNNNCFTNYRDGEEYNTYLYNYNAGSHILGPEDMLSGETRTFTFNSAMGYPGNLHSPSYLNCGFEKENYWSKIVLPPGYSLSPGTLTHNNVLLTLNTDYTISGQEITINIGGSGNYKMDLTLTCGSQALPNPSYLINWEMFYRCSTTCTSCDYKVNCASFEVFNHCLGGTCGGYSTTSFDTDRISLGWQEPGSGSPLMTYSQWSATPKVTPSTPGINLEMLMEYDTIRAVAKGVLVAGSYTYSHITIQYKTPIDPSGTPYNILEFLSGRVLVNNTVCSAGVIGSPVITSSGDIFVFDLKFLTGSCGIVVGDHVDYEILFRVKKIPDSYGTDYRDITNIDRFRATHRGSNDGINAVGCQSFGDNMQLYSPYIFVENTDAYMSCKGVNKTARLRTYIGQFDRFPAEFRPFASIRKFSFPNDPLLTYQSGSSVFEYNIYCCPWYTNPIINPNITSSTVTWDYSLPANIGGRFVAEPGYWLNHIYANFTKNCGNASYQPEPFDFTMEYDEFIYTKNPAFIETESSTIQSNVQDVSKANLALAPQALQEGYKTSVQWKVTITNISTAERRSNADKVWISVEPSVPGIHIIAATLNSVPVTLRPYGNANFVMLELGLVELNKSYELIISSNYTNCVEDRVDPIALKASWVCANKAYPLTPAQADCQNAIVQSELQLRYKNTDLGVVSKRISPLGDVNVCVPLTYQAEIKSSGYADLENVVFTTQLSEDISYVPSSATYTYNGITTALSPPTFLNGGRTLRWNLSSMMPLYDPSQLPNPDGLGTGILPGNRIPNKNILLVSFQVEAKCGIDAGEALVTMTSSATTNCGDNRVFAPYDDKIFIEGLNPLDKMKVTVNCNAFDSQNLANISAVAANIGTVTLGQDLPTVKRYMAITLPAGIVYEPGTASEGEPERTTVLSNGSNMYWWPLPPLAPVAPGNSLILNFKIRKQSYNVLANGNQVTVTASTLMLATDLFCASENRNCEVKATTAKASCTIRVTTVFCEACVSAYGPEEGKKYVVSGWVKEGKNPGTLPTYTKSSISLYFGGADVTIGPFFAKGDIIDGWQRIEEVFTVPANITSMEIRLSNRSASGPAATEVFFDDLRVHPFNSNMKTFTYDPYTLRLAAELDENNYATFYEYDQEGGLIRVKKETEKGVKTIQESRSNNVKK